MKIFYSICFFVLCFDLAYAQQKNFTIKWDGSTILETVFGKKVIPSFDRNHFNFTDQKGLTYFAQWDATNGDLNNVSISKVVYQTILATELKDLRHYVIPNDLNFKFYNVNARGHKSYYFELNPIIKTNGIFKKVISFSINYNLNRTSTTNLGTVSRENSFRLQNSVLATGQWYRFYIEKSGVFRLTKRFLTSLGMNTNADPRTIKIYGNGGRMLPLLIDESNPYPTDVEENAIKFIGEEDGVFNNEDYVLFYGEGPNNYNNNIIINNGQEINSNLNLYTNKTYYYVNVSPGNGKRIQEMPAIRGTPNLQINTFQDYQFYEVDDVNIAKLGRRWFGDDFDIENQRSYTFNFSNLVTSEPINLSISVGAVSETQTNMTITVNNNEVDILNFRAVNSGGSNLASDDFFQGNANSNTDIITVNLSYNNNSNPSASAFLDFINIEATRNLTYAGEQFQFKNITVNSTPGIVEYSISNANNVDEVWDITDRFNISNTSNTNKDASYSFKAQSGGESVYLAFNYADAYTPLRDSKTIVLNQDLKGTIFNNAQGQFQDIDYIIITPSPLQAQAERLAKINNERYNLNVKVVTLNAIYTEFSTGSQDIAAIRNFIKYVYDNASTPLNRLKYVCLFGDGSYDYKDRIINNTNLVPSWHSLNSFSLSSSFVSDDFYGIVDNGEGEMKSAEGLDIAVGRILADSPQRAKELIDKIEQYYSMESLGYWRNNVLLISDDVDQDWEEILQETTDGLGTALENQSPYINVIKVHSDAFLQESTSAGDRYPKVNTAIKNVLDVGVLVANYFGHGGEDGLANERIFDRNDAQDIKNICKYSLFITVTCEYARFDNPSRLTSGELMYWNKTGGAIALFSTTRQINVEVGVDFNKALDDYLFAFNGGDYPAIGEVLRLTKNDNLVAGKDQKYSMFLFGDPAMKLTFPKPDIKLTKINDVDISLSNEVLQALSNVKLSGEVTDKIGNILSNYNGTLTATVFDKHIERQTLANDGTKNNNGQLIKLDFTQLGEIIFKGQASITNGSFEFNFVVPRDIVISEGNGKVSFYARKKNLTEDHTGANFDIRIGGVNENAPADNQGPLINLFLNDENFVSNGITNEAPILLAKLQDDNGINTAGGIGHDITAILDGNETNPFILNDYYQANIDDYTSGVVTFPFRDLEPGLHTLSFKAWDTYNNSSTAEIQFNVFNQNETLVINNVLNYPNPFVNYTEFWFNHNSSEPLDITVQIFTVSGKLIKTLNGQTTVSSKAASNLSKDIIWDGRDDFGAKIGKGVYIYKLKVRSSYLNKVVEKIEKLVIL